MKALVTSLAFSGAIGLSALIVALQNDPLLFTSAERAPVVELTAAPRLYPVTVLEATAAASPAAISLEEITIQASPTRAIPRPPPEPEPEPELVIPEIVAAPCVDGEYRELEPGRGVYLMCPQAE